MREKLQGLYRTIRRKTEGITRFLQIEDYGIQGMEDVSPPKWHLAHTTWFFEAFILKNTLFNNHYVAFDKHFAYLFNSYYQGIGTPYPRAKRGLLSRPSVEKVYAYRHYVDNAIEACLEKLPEQSMDAFKECLILGLEHEQQHQELLLMDIKYNFSLHPDFPIYCACKEDAADTKTSTNAQSRILIQGGLKSIGYDGLGFCFDNELPRHKKMLAPFSIAKQLVTNGDYLAFMEALGYQNPAFWLADGWNWVCNEKIQSPLYWYCMEGQWMQFTLTGLKPLNLAEPLCHVSYYEADAYARFVQARLPTEEEWETAASSIEEQSQEGNFLESAYYHPRQLFEQHEKNSFGGGVWQWTASSYLPYPRYQPLSGVLGEYNGKFMSNQMVARGGSCITPKDHWRISYRNFYPPDKRWFFSGIRLAFDDHQEQL